mgnify:FL=1
MMEFISLLEQNLWVYLGLVTIVSLALGSFLNVVIYRLPLMMEAEWREQCHELLELEAEPSRSKPLSLAFPASSCPNCGHKIRVWENIPVLGFILLGGKCSNCKQPISLEYPVVEAVTAILSVSIAYHFGFGWQTLLGLVLTWSLIALTMIDFHKQLLPDSITLPLMWLGLISAIFNVYVDLESAVIGAIAGYLSLWTVYQVFKLATGKEGMGFGDFKLLAALGAWMGWKMLPMIILLSSAVGAVIGIALIIFTKHDKRVPIPFGPYLAIAGWIAFIWGEEITRIWLGPF